MASIKALETTRNRSFPRIGQAWLWLLVVPLSILSVGLASWLATIELRPDVVYVGSKSMLSADYSQWEQSHRVQVKFDKLAAAAFADKSDRWVAVSPSSEPGEGAGGTTSTRPTDSPTATEIPTQATDEGVSPTDTPTPTATPEPTVTPIPSTPLPTVVATVVPPTSTDIPPTAVPTATEDTGNGNGGGNGNGNGNGGGNGNGNGNGGGNDNGNGNGGGNGNGNGNGGGNGNGNGNGGGAKSLT